MLNGHLLHSVQLGFKVTSCGLADAVGCTKQTQGQARGARGRAPGARARIPRNVTEGRTMATRGCGFGFRLSGSVSLLVVLCLVLPRGASGVLAQSQPQSNYADRLNAKEKRFVEYQKDFVDFAKAAVSSDAPALEYETAFELQTVAGETADRLHAARIFMEIYSKLSCEEDRARIAPVIEREFLLDSQQMELSIKEATVAISYMKRPGVAAEAVRMKDDLREARSSLDSIKLH